MARPSRARPIRFLFENSLFLIAGAFGALIWANVDAESYHHFVEQEVLGGASLHFLINDVGMAVFFGIAAKEVWEALLPGGALSNMRKAATPLVATVGGMVVPAAVYMLVVVPSGEMALSRGWPIPMATDIAFSYMVARLIFGPGHTAIPFLLLLAIADDAGGMIVIAVFLSEDVQPVWLLLTLAAVVLGLVMRGLKLKSFWWYLLGPGVLSWFSLHEAGVHAALGLIPIIPTMPHAHTDLGIFVRNELGRRDALNAFEHWWKNPVELILGLFGLVNAGVAFGNTGAGTTAVVVGLLVGKPLGITLSVWVGQKTLSLQVPAGMDYRHVFVVGVAAAIGFTVALFVCTAAFPLLDPANAPEQAVLDRVELLDSVKMGALLSFVAAPLTFLAAKLMRIRKLEPDGGASENTAREPE